MQKSSKWENLARARELLQLGDSCTINQIKQAYRELAKVHHPDTASAESSGSGAMQDLNDAYRTLLEHCKNYAIPLEKGENQTDEDEDWWVNRFGNDPLWGKKRD